MASYFDEHGGGDDQGGAGGGWAESMANSSHSMNLLDILLRGGELPEQFGTAPPAAPMAIAELEDVTVDQKLYDKEEDCLICQDMYEKGQDLKRMPCSHLFHHACILPWLKKTNSCPKCRHELPTLDAAYEAMKHAEKTQTREDETGRLTRDRDSHEYSSMYL
eukprot:GFYU01002978.1.p1 GENE.GFYU01002978.1~~GFYU01002978.1.p1  ORF type:complete len:163 (-),score=22.94 GFYU01002978.1:88-576(-)